MSHLEMLLFTCKGNTNEEWPPATALGTSPEVFFSPQQSQRSEDFSPDLVPKYIFHGDGDTISFASASSETSGMA